MEAAAQTAVDAEKWIGLMKRYVNPTELTAELLNTLIAVSYTHLDVYKRQVSDRPNALSIVFCFFVTA